MGSCQHELHLKPPAKTNGGELENTGLSRKNSRTRGINLNTVSPLHDLATIRASLASISTNEMPLKSADSDQSNKNLDGETQDVYPGKKRANSALALPLSAAKLDFSLPTSADLENLDMNDKLRLLALKEMAVVELKDSMAVLQAKIYSSERDLQSLRTVIQRSLYRQLKNEPQPANTLQGTTKDRNSQRESMDLHKGQVRARKPRENTVSTSLPSTQNRAFSGSNNGPGFTASASTQNPTRPQNESQPQNKSMEDHSSKLWTNLAKPITFIQNLDQMLLHEFEKSLLEEPTTINQRESQSGLDNGSNQFRQLMDSKLTGVYNRENSDDMFQAVSNSLWGFVNDMKTNMVSSLVPEPWPTHTTENHRITSQNLQSDKVKMADLVSPKQPQDQNDRESSVDLLEFSDEEEETVDLSMYSAMRQKGTK